MIEKLANHFIHELTPFVGLNNTEETRQEIASAVGETLSFDYKNRTVRVIGPPERGLLGTRVFNMINRYRPLRRLYYWLHPTEVPQGVVHCEIHVPLYRNVRYIYLTPPDTWTQRTSS